MAIFSSTAREAPPMENRRRSDHITLSIIAKDLTVVGDLSSEGVVKIEGTVEGVIRAATQILVAPGAVIRGDLHTAEAVIGGRVEGTVYASDRVEVQSTAAIQGDVVTRRIVVLEGGMVNGAVKMGASPEPGLGE